MQNDRKCQKNRRKSCFCFVGIYRCNSPLKDYPLLIGRDPQSGTYIYKMHHMFNFVIQLLLFHIHFTVYFHSNIVFY